MTTDCDCRPQYVVSIAQDIKWDNYLFRNSCKILLSQNSLKEELGSGVEFLNITSDFEFKVRIAQNLKSSQ